MKSSFARRSRRRKAVAEPVPVPEHGTAADLVYAYEPAVLRPGNTLTPLVDGDQAYPEMLEAIEAAERYIHLEMYIFRADRIGEVFLQALIRRARAGVTVRMIIDAFGSISFPVGYIGDLLDAGVQFHEYRPLAPWRNWGRWARRDHRKILIVDGRVAFTGGLNIGDEYAPRELGGEAWRDTHVRIEGPIVADLEALFSSTWHKEGCPPYQLAPVSPRDPEPRPDARTCLASVVGNRERRQRTGIRRAYLHAIATARDYIYIANAYFVPDSGIRRALRRAARRGVRVLVMTPEHSDLRSVQWAGERTFARLLRGGVRIFLWRGTMLHAKTAVIDGVWSTIGSYNIDYVSLFQNLEVNVQVVDRQFGEQMRRIYEADLERCRELDLDTWRKRPWWRKLLERLFYRFRRWF